MADEEEKEKPKSRKKEASEASGAAPQSALDKEREAKRKALGMSLDRISKNLGKGTVICMGEKPIEKIDVIPSGSLGIDCALGIGGYPRGRIIEIFGPESSGKTTLAIHAIAEAQKRGGLAAFIDAEHAFDPAYAQALGVNMDDLYMSQPDSGEQALEVLEELISSAAMDIVVVDSVAALTPQAEIDGDMGENKVGLQARLMSQATRKITGVISKTHTTCIFINQLREKIGVMFGNPETTTGGNALKFYASVRVDVRRVSPIKNGDKVVGYNTRVKIVKNKVAPPFRKTEFEIRFGQGIAHVGEVVDLGVTFGVIEKSGSWFSYGSSKLAQGREGTIKVLTDNADLLSTIEAQVREELMKTQDGPNQMSATEIAEAKAEEETGSTEGAAE